MRANVRSVRGRFRPLGQGLVATVLAAIAGTLVALTPLAATAQVRARDVPLSAWAGLPAVSSVSVSDDGTRLAYVRRTGDRSEVIVQSRAGEVLVAVDVSDRRFSGLAWLSPDHVGITSLVLEDRLTIGTSQLPQMDVVNVRTRGVARVLRSADKGVINAVYGVTRGVHDGVPTLYVEAITSEDRAYTYDVYRVDLDTGRGRRIAIGQSDTRGYLIRPDGEVAARIAESDDATRFRLTAPGGGGWRTVYETVSLLDGPGVWGFGHDRDHAMISVTEGEQVFLVEINLRTGEVGERTLLSDAPTGPIYDRENRLVAMATYGEEGSHTFFEPRLAEGWSVLRRGLADRRSLGIQSFSDDFQTLVIRSEGPTDAGTFYLYDAAARSVSVVGRAYPDVPVEAIAPILLIDYPAADGMALTGYLTLPPGREAKDLPLVMFPHGGPASRDYLAFDWWAQAMASRGYAVFQPQFRGSDGFGEAHLQAGYGEWGRKMQSDISDGLKFLAGQGIVDPARACLVGASYGGYAALQGVATEPDLWRCAVSVAGVSDLPRMLQSEARDTGYQNESRNPVIRYWGRFMGAEGRRDEVLIGLSPARRASAIQDPVLLIHGRDDTVVRLDQSEVMHRALLAAGKSSELVVLDGEDHGLSYGPTRLRTLEATMDFLLKHNPPD